MREKKKQGGNLNKGGQINPTTSVKLRNAYHPCGKKTNLSEGNLMEKRLVSVQETFDFKFSCQKLRQQTLL